MRDTSPNATSNRPKKAFRTVTAYQVLVNDEVTAEFFDLPSARNKAVEVGGRIRVESKKIEIE